MTKHLFKISYIILILAFLFSQWNYWDLNSLLGKAYKRNDEYAKIVGELIDGINSCTNQLNVAADQLNKDADLLKKLGEKK